MGVSLCQRLVARRNTSIGRQPEVLQLCDACAAGAAIARWRSLEAQSYAAGRGSSRVDGEASGSAFCNKHR